MRAAHATVVLLVVLTSLARVPALGAAEEALPAMIHLADGSVLPLQDWKLSYEYAVSPKGEVTLSIAPLRREARDLWLGKRTLPLAGLTLEVRYVEEEREREMDGEMRRMRVPVARSLVLRGADGKARTFKLEPPHADLLAPGASGLVQARSLDLRGQSITGTRRQLCLFSYSILVECLVDPSDQIVKIEFPE